MTRIHVDEEPDRRQADSEFRRHMQDHLDDFKAELSAFRSEMKANHEQNQERLSILEASAKKAERLVDEWMGPAEKPELGLRLMVHQMVQERRLIGMGWKVLAVFGTIGTAVLAGWTGLKAAARWFAGGVG